MFGTIFNADRAKSFFCDVKLTELHFSIRNAWKNVRTRAWQGRSRIRHKLVALFMVLANRAPLRKRLTRASQARQIP
jgi:hypothetical protein